MRASATSRISSAHLHAAQNKPDTNKTDEASPFAILVQEAAPKDAAKTAHKDAHASDDNRDGDKQTVKKDNKADTAKPVQTAKAEKTEDKTDDNTANADKPDDNAQEAAAAQDQAAQPQPVNAQVQQAAQPGLVPPAANDDGNVEDVAAAGETQDSKAAPQAAQNNAPAAPEEDPAQDAQAAAGQALADKALAGKPAAKPTTKTGEAKTEGVKAAKANAAIDNSAATNSADAQKDIKADAVNAALNDKAAAHDAGRDTNHGAINSLAAPQSQAPAQGTAPTLTQHVQVTAQAQPNVPALAVEIAAKSQSGAKQFDIRLDPPELGRVEVRLSIDATGKASAHLSADQQQTLDLLQKDAPALTRALREAGLDVSQDGLNFSLRHQGSQDSNANNGGSRGTGRGFNLSATTTIEATATSAAYRSVADGRLDIRV